MNTEYIAIYVKNLEKSAHFYETCFQGKRNTLYVNPDTGFSSYFLPFRGSASLELMNVPAILESDAAAMPGYARIAFQVGSKDGEDNLTAQLKKDG